MAPQGGHFQPRSQGGRGIGFREDLRFLCQEFGLNILHALTFLLNLSLNFHIRKTQFFKNSLGPDRSALSKVRLRSFSNSNNAGHVCATKSLDDNAVDGLAKL